MSALALVGVSVGAAVGCAVIAEWLYRRRHPYVIGLRPFSAGRYARYLHNRLEALPSQTARCTEPYRRWAPLLARHPGQVRFFRDWHRFKKASGLDAELPWLTFGAVAWLERYLQPGMRVFEWGSGGSTLFFARRVRSLVTVEHDAAWYERVAERLRAEGVTNCEYLLHEPAIGADDGYMSAEPELAGFNLREYCTAIDSYPVESFDLVVVDGRARPACIARACTKIRPGGAMVVDNTERGEYREALELLDDWMRHDFAGPATFYSGFSTTSVFLRH